jgi:hypothetical protein
VIDVSSLTEDNLTVLRSHFSAEQLPIFVMALYVTECTQRLEMVAPRLLDALPHVASEESVEARVPLTPRDCLVFWRARWS